MSSPAFILPCAKLRTDYLVFVDEPARDGPLAVALVMDGDDQFEAAREAAAELRRAGAIPPLLLAGVGYGGSYRSPKNRRARDYTPTRPADEPMETGGAPAFLEFLQEELLPALGRRYEIKPGDVAIVGHSLGSLFGLYALSAPPSPFRRHLISSPSIWWDNRSVLALLAAAAGRPRTPARAFFSVGADDTPSMCGDLELLERQLAAKPLPNLEHVFVRLEGKDHYSALPAAFRAGLRWLYS
ncbi:MAG TPA: alpha/beta hydrolase-fold protein [Opitutaceae bacterium]|nr:alpha/beta hydrolase-fold protein [Opitutaceae bacterium]